MNNTNSNGKRDQGKREYGFLIYEESAPKDYLQWLEKTQINIVLSPWHDQDIDDNGNIKKKHRHGYVMFNGNRTKAYMDNYFCMYSGAVLMPDGINDTRNFIRYFIHKDSPNKAQYDLNDVIIYGNEDFKTKVLSYFEDKAPKKQNNKFLTNNAEFLIVTNNLIKNNNIQDFQEFIEKALELNDNEYIDAIMVRHSIIDKIIVGQYKRNRRELEEQQLKAIHEHAEQLKQVDEELSSTAESNNRKIKIEMLGKDENYSQRTIDNNLRQITKLKEEIKQKPELSKQYNRAITMYEEQNKMILEELEETKKAIKELLDPSETVFE